jgi:nucleoside phosphorylase
LVGIDGTIGGVDPVDVLVVSALPVEFEQARAAGSAPPPVGFGVSEWVERDRDGTAPYLFGAGVRSDGGRVTVALARPARMGGRTTGAVTAVLVERLRPCCLVMCGVCAGNPAAVGLGDVVVAEIAYAYDEGQQTAGGLVADHRQLSLDPGWLRAAQDFSPIGLPSHGPASDDEATLWVLDQLLHGRQPRTHPARDRYLPPGTWTHRMAALEEAGLAVRRGTVWELTEHGHTVVERARHDDVDGPRRMPFAVVVGPMASGSAVVRDGVTWDRIGGMGVRTVAALEMEAATVATVAQQAQIAHWLVVKGVSDHADPAKDDRYRRFAARASAEVLFALLNHLLPKQSPPSRVKPSRRALALLVGILLIGLVAAGSLIGAQLASDDRGATTPDTPAPSQFFGTIRFDETWNGRTRATGQSIDGTVTAWSPGFQIWLFARPENTDTVIAQGPCRVDGERWTCTDLKLAGPRGALQALDVVVAPDAEAATYAGRTTVPRGSASDSTEIYKG